MTHPAPTEPITIRAEKKTVNEIDALAAAMDRSRNYVVNLALKQYIETNAWQIERIEAGISAARKGHVRDADAVFDAIEAKHGWKR